MRLKSKTFLGVLLAAFLFAAGWVLGIRPDPKSPTLASAGGIEITAESFRTRYVKYLLKSGVRDAPGLRKTFLDDFVATRLLIQEEREMGIEQNDAYRFRREVVLRKLLVDAYARHVLLDTLEVSEDEVLAMFVRTQTRIKPRHLYARTRQEADAFYARLLSGESFDELAREVFSDPNLANNGGSLGYVEFDELDPDFEDAAYALEVGEISKPVRTAYGYSIIELEDRFTNPLMTEFEYAKRRSNLRAYVLGRKQERARRRHVRRLAEELVVTFSEVALERLLGQITGKNVLESDEEFARLASEPLVIFGPPTARSTWTIGEFRDLAGYTSEDQRSQVRTREDLIDFVQGLLVRQTMMDRARELGLDSTPELEMAEQDAMNEYVLDRVRERMSSETRVPEDSIRSYFDSALPGEFIHPEQIRVREILLSTESEADEVTAKLPRSSFEALARLYTIRPGARETAGDLGFLTEEQLGPLNELVFNTSNGEVVGPIELEGRYAFYQVEERLKARRMAYDEAHGRIADMLRFRYKRDHRLAVYKDVRSRYEVDVDTALLYSMSLTDENDG